MPPATMIGWPPGARPDANVSGLRSRNKMGYKGQQHGPSAVARLKVVGAFHRVTGLLQDFHFALGRGDQPVELFGMLDVDLKALAAIVRDKRAGATPAQGFLKLGLQQGPP